MHRRKTQPPLTFSLTVGSEKLNFRVMSSNRTYYDPAFTVIRRLGGVTKVAELCQIGKSQTSSWHRGIDVGGTGGKIPSRYHTRLWRLAQERGANISLEDIERAPSVARVSGESAESTAA